MDAFTIDHLLSLTDPGSASHCVSVYLPTHPTGLDGKEDAVWLKNLLDRAETLLVEHGVRSCEACDFVQRARDLTHDGTFWNRRGRGLAMFLTQNSLRTFRLPDAFDELVVVQRRFHIKPLLPLVGSDLRFLLLALSRNQVRLWEGTRFSMQELRVAALPTNLAESLNYQTPERSSQVHSGAKLGGRKQSGVFHGQGGESETAKDELGKFLRLVDGALQPVLRDEHAPLLLAAVSEVAAMYRAVTSYSHVLETTVAGNPDHTTEHELHERAWPLIEPLLTERRQDAVAKFRRLIGTGKASDDLFTVLPAAAQGRIESLFVDTAAQCWGQFGRGSPTVEIHDQPHQDDDELLDLAAVKTLQAHGAVYAPRSDSQRASVMPSASPIAAVFRY